MQFSDSESGVRKRPYRHLLPAAVVVVLLAGGAWFLSSQATTTVVFVRHAEKMLEPADDPELSEAGRRRAAVLTELLMGTDIVPTIDAIYSTPLKRCEETVQPLADALQLPIRHYAPTNTEQILETILAEHRGAVVLVVGHSNTIPELVANLGTSENVPAIEHGEYDKLYVVSVSRHGKANTIRLSYGEPYRGADGDENNQAMSGNRMDF